MNTSTENTEDPGEERTALTNPQRMYYILLKVRQVEDGGPGDEKDSEEDDEEEDFESDDSEELEEELDEEEEELEDEESEAEEAAFEDYLEALQSLSEEERLDLATLLLIGRGDFTAEEWNAARAEAAAIASSEIPSYVASVAEAGDYIASGLSALGYSFDEFEENLRE